MTCKVTGIGLEPVTYLQPTLVDAAKLALKMLDQGVSDVRVYDDSEKQVPEREWLTIGYGT